MLIKTGTGVAVLNVTGLFFFGEHIHIIYNFYQISYIVHYFYIIFYMYNIAVASEYSKSPFYI